MIRFFMIRVGSFLLVWGLFWGLVIAGGDLLFELAVVELADGGHGHGVDELVAHRLHIFGQLLGAELAQLLDDLTLFDGDSGLRVQHDVTKGRRPCT